MLPIGTTVYLWRNERKLTQEQLARAAGISRPNLSNLERGGRELSLQSLRLLASALKVTPGTLVDGIPPLAQNGPLEFSRRQLDQIADAAFKNKKSAGREGKVADLLNLLTYSRISAATGKSGGAHPKKRAVRAAWLHFKSALRKETAQALIQRMEDREITAGG